MRTIPLRAVGPGSQPEDEALSYFALPSAEPIASPLPPEDATPAQRAQAADVLDRLLATMARGAAVEDAVARVVLDALPAGTLRTLNEALGQGEVSATVAAPGGHAWSVQETAFAGVWRVQRDDGRRRVVADFLEAGDMPEVVKDCASTLAHATLDAARLPAGVMNAPALVSEIRHHARAFRPGGRAHVINLSLLPLNAADHEGLGALLGIGPIAILSRGFGNCRITATRVRSVWRVSYFNSMSTPILDTIEIVDVPEAALATGEDLDDSRERLGELIAWMRED